MSTTKSPAAPQSQLLSVLAVVTRACERSHLVQEAELHLWSSFPQALGAHTLAAAGKKETAAIPCFMDAKRTMTVMVSCCDANSFGNRVPI